MIIDSEANIGTFPLTMSVAWFQHAPFPGFVFLYESPAILRLSATCSLAMVSALQSP